MTYTSIPIQRQTFVEYNYKKRLLERHLKKGLSHDDFLTILLFDRKIILHKRNKTAEVMNATILTI